MENEGGKIGDERDEKCYLERIETCLKNVNEWNLDIKMKRRRMKNMLKMESRKKGN